MTEEAIDIHDLVAQMGGEVVSITPFNQPLGEERTMLDKMKAEIERLQGVAAQHEQAMRQHAEGAQQCRGAIYSLQAMIADEEKEPEGENEDDPH